MVDQGEVRIVLRRPEGAGRPCATVLAPPPLPVARVLVGQPPEVAVRRAAMLFNVCGAAQGGAMRAALGLPADPDAPARILAETLRDHALKLTVGWPRALGLPADPAGPAAVAGLKRDGGAALRRALFGPDGLPDDLAGFETWLDAGACAAARVLARVWRDWSPEWGAGTLPLWAPGGEPPDLARAEWRGGAFESGLPALRADTPLMQAIAARRGQGLAWRLAARLVDAAAALDALAGAAPCPEPRVLEPGLGAAPAARGTMLVRGAVETGCVARLDRLSPTDAALHPQGLLNRLLATLPPEPDAPLPDVAALVLEAADLCLPHTLTLTGSTHSEESPHVHRLRLLG